MKVVNIIFMKIMFILFLIIESTAFALNDQREVPDINFLSTQTTSTNPYTVPVYVNERGEISLLSRGSGLFSLQPVLQTGLGGGVIRYVRPVFTKEMMMNPIKINSGWIEEKRVRLEFGLGLNAVKSQFSLGLIPFKGALNTTISHKDDLKAQSISLLLPTKFNELKNWNIQDQGIYQTYGGVSAFANFGVGPVNLGNLSFGLQNQFIVLIQKITQDEVLVKISEEELNRRQFIFGPLLSTATFGTFQGKRISLEFILNLEQEEHGTFYQKALAGHLSYVQERLPFHRQKFIWEGREKHYYLGIPMVAGKLTKRGQYDLHEDEKEAQLDFKSHRTTGFFTPLRNHRDLILHTGEDVIFVWTSEMTKTKAEIFKQRFLNPGRILGLRGFEREIPEEDSLGTVVSQMIVHLKKEELTSPLIRPVDFEKNLRSRCAEMELPCQSEKHLRKLLQKLSRLMERPWAEVKDDWGLFFMENPVLIYASVKTMEVRKEVYFKFLSDRFQSMEGISIMGLDKA
jgi:hypothetical protein